MPQKNAPFTVFVVEDDEWYNKLLVHNLSIKEHYHVVSFFSAKELLAALNQGPNVVTVDYRLPDMLGSELLKKIKAFDPSIEVVMISEQDEIEVAVELLKQGAADYLVKSKTIKDRLLHAVGKIEENVGLKSELQSLKKEIETKYDFQKTLIGKSDNMQTVFDLMKKSLNTNITVSITGETGTGKEVVAKAIHYNSNRKDGPFIAINVAAIPNELIESELFGHEKGAFTGAIVQRKGKFVEANGGTLFLDEIGELDISLQAKLLRVLQEKEVTPIGSNKTIKINCRIIVATNKDLLEETKNGNFREDLYYRFLGLSIHLPPLSERGDDTLLLAKHFINSFCKENSLDEKKLSEEARFKLKNHSWPGNIRELKSVMDLACVMTNTEVIEADDISLNNKEVVPNVLGENLSMRDYEIKIVQLYMKKHGDNTKAVADDLQIGQTTVYRLLKEAESKK